MSIKTEPIVLTNEIEILTNSGTPGPPGFYYTPSISEDGILSWSNNGNLPNPEDFDLKQASPVTSVNKKIGDVVLKSQDIDYSDELTIKDALDQLLYIEPKIISFKGGGQYEIGEVLTNKTLTWSLNKDIKTQTLNNGIGEIANDIRSYLIEDDISTNRVYTLTINDGKKSVSESTSFSFLTKNYYGVSPKETLTNDDILKMTGYLSNSRIQSRTFDCSGGNYFYFIIPKNYCDGIKFKVGGLSYTDMVIKEQDVTNKFQNVTTYNIYRSGNIQNGSSINVEIL